MRDATHYRSFAPHVPNERGAERHNRAVNDHGQLRFWTAPVPVEEALAAGTAPKRDGVPVEGNHGRWVVICPTCRAAQLADPVDRRFMCHSCANAAVNGLWRPVIWPKNHEAIATVLDQRPNMADRNYEWGETVDQLREQNELLAGATVLEPVQLQGAAWPDGHTHAWPRQVKDDVVYVCEGCGARYDGAAIRSERKAGG